MTVRRLRVFPRRVKKSTPCDQLARVGPPGWLEEADEIWISVTFSWDMPEAERIAEQWAKIAPVRIGGPATGMRGEAFEPGMFLKPGYTITSRGCPECCWFCGAWRRDGAAARELPIRDGWNVLDDNLLACSEGHIRSVFAMLARQRQRAEFTGGLHAARLKPWHVDLLSGLPQRPVIFLAYDEDRDLDPLRVACQMLIEAGWYRQRLRAYVLCGYEGDTQTEAEARMRRVMQCGADPMAMVYRGKDGVEAEGWHAWARQWIRPGCMHKANSQICVKTHGGELVKSHNE